jgi:HSP20 family protein
MVTRGIPQSVWKKIKAHSGDVLGASFWNDIAQWIPQQGPRIDVYETERDIVIHMELAGLSSIDRIKVTSNGKMLMIQGEMPVAGPDEEDAYMIRERYRGPFHRRIELPANARTDTAAARLQEGLLTVWLTKLPEQPDEELPVEYKPG